MTLHLREIDSEGFILDGHLSVSNTSELSAINISDNSFWMGDETLISLSGGKIKFKKRNKSVVPPAILQAGVEAGHESHQVTTDAALAHAGVATVHDMKLSDWYKYMRTLKGDDTPGLNDVFSSYTDNDFEETLTLAGNVGVGAANPIAKLHISNAGALYTAFSDTNAGTDEKNWWTSVLGNQLTHYISNDANNASQPYMQVTRDGYTVNSVIFNNGKVAVGTTNPSHGRVQIQCTSQTPDGGLTIRGGDFAAGLGAMWVEGSGSGQRFNIQAYKNESTDPPSGVNPSIADADAYELCLNPKGGNVGIRTSDPGAPLEVHGADLTGQAVGTTSLISRYVAGEDGVLNIFGINQSYGEEGIGLQTQIDGRSWQSDLSEWSAGSEGRYNLCLQPYKGNVGIGSTNPSQKFEVNGNILLSHGDDYAHNTDDRTLYIGGRNNSGSLVQAKCAIVATPSTSHGGAGVYGRSALHFCVGPDGNNDTCASKAHSRLCITHAGNVGVGTVYPTARLTVSSVLGGSDNAIPAANMGEDTAFPPTTHLWLANKHSAHNPYWGLAIGTIWTGESYIQNLNKRTNNYYNLLLQPNGGNVGIRRANPEHPLDVTGSIRCSGHVYANHLNMSHGRGDRNGDNTFYSSTDNYLRKNTASGMISSLGLDNRYIRKDADSTVNTNVNLTWSKSDEPSIKVQNQSYSAWLYVGGWSSSNNNDISRVRASNGNLHLDSAANGTLYLNHYSGGNINLGRNTDVRGSIFTQGSQTWNYDNNNKMYIDNGGTIRRNYSGLGSGFHFTNAAIWPTDCNGNYNNGGIALGSWEYQYSGVYTRFVNSLHQNQASYFGPSAVGYIAHDNYAAFGHRSKLEAGAYGMLVSSDGHTFVNMAPDKTLHFRCGNVDKIRMHSNGYLAFGNEDPKAPIDISYYASGTVSTSSYYNSRLLSWSGLSTFAGNYYAAHIAANFDGGGVAAHTFYAGYSINFQSDSRIKKDIKSIDDSEALDKLRRLKPSTYKYSEPVFSQKSRETVYGFIAQEVAEVLPYAVRIGQTKDTDNNHIPNIMSVCAVETEMITPEEYDKLSVEQQAEYHFLEDHAGDVCEEEEDRYAKQTFTIEETYDLNKVIDERSDNSFKCGYENAEVKFDLNDLSKDSEGKYDQLVFTANHLHHLNNEIKEVIDSFTFTCKKFMNPSSFLENDRTILYGQKVSDFHNLDKNAIFTIATAALQEVDRQLQQEKEKVRTLEMTVQSVLERLALLEQK